MDEATLTRIVAQGLLSKQAKSWADEDEQTYREARSAAMSAIAYVRKRAGVQTLDIGGQADVLELTTTCAWYIAENRLAEFLADYGPELLSLRLMEGFGCGKE